MAPGETMEKLVGLGIAQDDILLTWPNKEHRFWNIAAQAAQLAMAYCLNTASYSLTRQRTAGAPTGNLLPVLRENHDDGDKKYLLPLVSCCCFEIACPENSWFPKRR